MTKFVTVETHNGFIYWIGEAADAADACMATDADVGTAGPCEWGQTYSGDGSYIVYQVPADYTVHDGQSSDEIDALENQRRIGEFRRVS